MNTLDRNSCTFRIQVEEDGRVTLSTAIRTGAAAWEIAKAKETIHRLLDEYIPGAAVPEPRGGQTPEAEITDTTETATHTDNAHQAEESPAPVNASESERVKGLLRLRCPECGSTFGTFLKEYRREIACKCGHHIDLTAPLARYRFTCPYCEKDTWGQTNLEDPEITIRCRCGCDVDLEWVPKAKEYQN